MLQELREVIVEYCPEAITLLCSKFLSSLKFLRLFRCMRDANHVKLSVESPATARLAHKVLNLARRR
jgi:hypothetical protein